ncbi:MAG: hypothetical protein DWQ36_19040 [Acidobacteria bacterium]|nr:MAG: hypothetical protein DWQ30_06600 [Acidobacteriota bacterium]REK03646.1 MAG: hypothetical protein DWQ36_19040 [Acidobacteriota bacterium]
MIQLQLLVLLGAVAVNDPRIELVELQAADHVEEALALTERQLAEDPELAARRGLAYLQGHLLERLGRNEEAVQAFASVVATTPALANHARYRVARNQERQGHPEVAAGLTATLLGRQPPKALVEPALDLLERTLEQGGDCRLLGGLAESGLPKSARRRVMLADARCALRGGERDAARELLAALVEEQRTDLTGLLAAEQLMALQQEQLQIELAQLLGEAFHHHRRFEHAEPLLQIAVENRPAIRTEADFQTHYRLVRGRFWTGRFELAAADYGQLARIARTPQQTAQALYHRGRALELAGHWPAAIAAFRQAFQGEPMGNFAGASLLSALRLEWRLGSEATALELYDQLRRMPSARLERARAALFLASSELVRQREENAARVEGWLDDALAASRRASVEVLYWRGRLRESGGRHVEALEAYLQAVEIDYYHPLAGEAMARIDALPESAGRRQRARQEAAAGRAFRAFVLYGPRSSEGAQQLELMRRDVRRTYGREIAPVRTVSPSAWPLWNARLERPEDLLLALGLWHDGAPAARRHFPIHQPELAFTAALELQKSDRIRESLLISEILARAVPDGVPEPAIEDVFRRSTHPFAYRFLIERSAHRYGVDPKLLVALIREESRFDPRAASGAAARGLTQFVLPTATRLAAEIGLGPIGPLDLQEPETAIELGAAYLAELQERSGGNQPAMVASYNAGEAQADLWQLHCFSEESSEYLSKVGFVETRNYVDRVLRSYAIYRELYPPPRDRRLAAR